MVKNQDNEELFWKELYNLYVCHIPFLELFMWLGLILSYLPAPRSLPWDPRFCGSFSGSPFRGAAFHQFWLSEFWFSVAGALTLSLGSLRAEVENRGGRQGALASGCAATADAESCRGRPVARHPAGKASQAPHGPRASRVTRMLRPAFRSGWGWYIRRGGWDQVPFWALASSAREVPPDPPGEPPSDEGAHHLAWGWLCDTLAGLAPTRLSPSSWVLTNILDFSPPIDLESTLKSSWAFSNSWRKRRK